MKKNSKKAYACVSGPGYYELYINGQKAGDHVLDPAQTDFEKRVFYVLHDISALLDQGSNVFGIIAGNGWFINR